MKTRTAIVIMFVIICIFTIGFGVYLTIASVAPANILSISATPTPVPTVAITPTQTPTALQNFSNAESTIFGLSLSMLTYFATVLISVLILLLLLRIWILSGKSNLVIDTFNNTTGNDAIGKELDGLNQLTREFLARELANIQLLVNKSNDQGLDHFIEFPPPETAADVQLTTVLKSLIAASTGEAQTAVQLLNIVLTPRGTKVITTLHSLSELPVIFGLSFELMDLEGKREPVPVTFWEPAHVADSGTLNQAAPVGATVPQVQPVQLAQTYYELGEHLDRAGLYEDAITYFELALKQDGSFQQAVVSLGASLSRWQVQKSGVSACGVGKQLQDAGLLRPAIENYKIPLLPQNQVAAEHAWETVLKLRQGDEAHAYFSLGEFYREDGVYLFDQSLELYRAAIAHGSHAATMALQTRQQASARNLVEAAQILFGLKQFSDAEKYTTMALAEVPGDPDAQSLSGRLKEYKPTQGDPVALASYNLGHMYEMRGALDDAIDQYEAALKQQPDYGEASIALVRVLQNRRSPDQRFLELLKPAVRWLATEIALRSMEDQRGSWNKFFGRRKRQKNEWRTNYQAKLYNYFGYVHQISAPMFSSSALFYNRAIALFNKASQFDKTWFLPPMNLGVTHVMIARQNVGRQMPLQLSRNGVAEIYLALPFFKKAQKLLADYKKRQPNSRAKLSEAERMLTLYLSIAQILSRDPTFIQNAIQAVATMRNSGWVLENEKNSSMLYNLACWYGIADSTNIGVVQAKQEARCIITMCIAREPEFWARAYQEPDLKSISDEKGWQNLSRLLRRNRNQFPHLSELQGPDFSNIINSILQQMQWS